MDLEVKQGEIIDQFVKQASALKGSALGPSVVEATSHPALFAFSEILAVPNVIELEGTGNGTYLHLLRMFAHGTWSDYKRNSSRLPHLVPDQVLKLKQLTVLTMAETNKILPYDELMQQLDVKNVSELEDSLINECMYAGIVRGKLDQLRRCFEVQFAAGRNLRPEQLGNMVQTLSNWLVTSDSLLVTIQEKIKWADNMSEAGKKHKKDMEDKVDDIKKSLSLKKLNTISRATLTSEGLRRSTLNLVEGWTMRTIVADQKGDVIQYLDYVHQSCFGTGIDGEFKCVVKQLSEFLILEKNRKFKTSFVRRLPRLCSTFDFLF